MIARTIATVALAGAAVLVPSAAFAADTYPDAGDSLTCDASQVDVTNTVGCTVGAADGSKVALQVTTAGEDASIAGTVTSAAKTVSGNVASFTITAPSSTGTMGITAIIDGEAVDTASIEVVSSASTTTGDELSGTGFENVGLAAGAGVLLVAGAATVFVAARRRAAAN
ncbi:hypothetical protein QQX09_06055 [Demequina sp. SYSU T00192]|uniref:LPXTG-motif cell wall anchor domain-containing protein n=1 Tax=Demequina litoralis TaxID=3051660 RepID=A0ABT8G8Z9_9MICO|nr:hypothetical protein [Demequina sp. SYSU T00192]MDN4475419.1 hypothetical protein [Demequina sp. SYSU T00192]